MNTYRLDAALPVRAFGNAAVLLVVGGILVALASGLQWHVAVTIIGLVVLLLGAVLLTLALLVTFRGRARITITDGGYELNALGRTASRKWTDVTRATMTENELRLYVRDDEEHPDRVPLLDPARHRELDRLADEVTERMRQAYGRLD
ncbi:hypothetical protein GA0111570_103161 [Raineyella antarctica]|uniref:PH domain-containing protein n=1 Tax=Raineyella antarctica TaxID=1577474 RepID=A0A1G6GG01_9ACTN|nr:hypothetical protein [Raineyella antarctica]SDB80894.1 hypothetical protein GA0111570_103161 [Raineyella antarctica]